MLRTLMMQQNGWLLGLCAVFDAMISVLYLILYNAGPDAAPLGGWHSDALLLCRLSVAAGLCTIGAGVWRSAHGASWLLVLNGVAFSVYGLIPLLLPRTPLGFRLFAILIAVMALSFGLFGLTEASRRGLWRERRGEQWLFRLSGAASAGFALAFLALASGWIQLGRTPVHPAFFLWLCIFFGFSALCMLGLAAGPYRHLKLAASSMLPEPL